MTQARGERKRAVSLLVASATVVVPAAAFVAPVSSGFGSAAVAVWSSRGTEIASAVSRSVVSRTTMSADLFGKSSDAGVGISATSSFFGLIKIVTRYAS